MEGGGHVTTAAMCSDVIRGDVIAGGGTRPFQMGEEGTSGPQNRPNSPQNSPLLPRIAPHPLFAAPKNAHFLPQIPIFLPSKIPVLPQNLHF